MIVDNKVDARIYGVYTQDLGTSKIVTVRNKISAELDGVLVAQDARAAALPSDYLVAQNRISVNENGTSFLAGGMMVLRSTTTTYCQRAFRTTSQFGTMTSRWALKCLRALISGAMAKVTFALLGIGSRGVALDARVYVNLSQGTFVARNDLRTTGSTFADVYLTPTTRQCVVNQPNDSVLDEGTDNRVRN